MKTELFSGISPYGNLVRAIEDNAPLISSNHYSSQLITLTQTLLIKNPEKRLRFMTPKDIRDYINREGNETTLEGELLKRKFTRDSNLTKLEEIDRQKRSKEELKKTRELIGEKIEKRVLAGVKFLKNKDMFGEYTHGKVFLFQSQLGHNENKSIRNIPFILYTDFGYGIPRNFYFSIGIHCDEESICEISTVAFYPTYVNHKSIDNFQSIVIEAVNPKANMTGWGIAQKLNHNLKTTVTPTLLFEGLFSDDDAFQDKINLLLAKLINKAIEIGKPETEAELANRQEMINGRNVFVGPAPKVIFLDTITE